MNEILRRFRQLNHDDRVECLRKELLIICEDFSESLPYDRREQLLELANTVDELTESAPGDNLGDWFND